MITSALSEPAFAQCVVTGTGTLGNLDAGDVVNCTGTLPASPATSIVSDALNPVTVNIDGSFPNLFTQVGSGSTITIAQGASLGAVDGLRAIGTIGSATINVFGDLTAANPSIDVDGIVFTVQSAPNGLSVGTSELFVAPTGSIVVDGNGIVTNTAINQTVNTRIEGTVSASRVGYTEFNAGGTVVDNVTITGTGQLAGGNTFSTVLAAVLGSGNDSFTIEGDQTTITGGIDGGAGTDTFAVDLSASAANAAVTLGNSIAAFEKFEISSGAAGQSVALTNVADPWNNLDVTTSTGASVAVDPGASVNAVSVSGSGALELASGLNAISFNVGSGAELSFQSGNFAVNGAITGASDSRLSLQGGAVSLDNAIGFSGEYIVQDGELSVQHQDISASVSSISLESATSVFRIVDQNTSSNEFDTITANISGAGGLVIDAANDFITLTGTNTYSGGTDIASGTTLNGDVDSFGSGIIQGAGDFQISTVNGGTLANDLQVNSFSKFGAGELRLTSSNNIFGSPILVGEGTLVGDVDTFGTAAIFGIGVNSSLAIDTDIGGTFANDINLGNGVVEKRGTGTLTLTGNNSTNNRYSVVKGVLAGDQTTLRAASIDVAAGAVLRYDSTSNAIINNPITGDGRLVLSGTTGTPFLARDLTIAEIEIEAGAFQTRFEDLFSDSVELSGASGVLVLSNLLSGTTTLATDFLGIDGSRIDIVDNGDLALTGDNSGFDGTIDASSGPITISGDLNALNVGAFTGEAAITLTGTQSGDLRTNLSDDTSLSLDASGTRINLTGTNTFTGGVMVVDGTLAGGVDVFGTADDIEVQSNGILELTALAGSTDSFDRRITGDGRLEKTGQGTVDLLPNTANGPNNFTGGISVREGVLIGNANTFGSGAIDVDSGAEARLVTGSASFANDVAGTGIFGAQSVSNTRLGGLISVDTLQIQGGDFSIDIAGLQSNGVDVLGTGTILIDSLPSGSNSLATAFTGDATGRVQFDAGSLTLTGDNTGFAGALEATTGSIISGDLSALNVGELSGDGAFILTGASDGDLTANIVGGGMSSGFAFDSTGNVSFIRDLSGVSDVTLSNGIFRVNGTSFVAPVSVESAATLGGEATITGDVVATGTIAPGNSIGTLNIDGNVAFESGSTLQVEFDDTSIDLLDVSGTATINSGSTLLFVPLNGASSAGGTFLQAASGVTGEFDTVTVQGGGNVSVAYTATTGTVTTPMSGGGTGGGGTDGGGMNGNSVILSATPDHLSAEASVIENFTYDVTSMLGQQLIYHSGDARRGAWGGYLGGFGDRDVSENINEIEFDQNGFVGGIDFPLSDKLSLGVAVAWTDGSFNIENIGVENDTDTVYGALVARAQLGDTALAGGIGFGGHDLRTARRTVFDGTTQLLSRETDAFSTNIFVRGRHPVLKEGPLGRLSMNGAIDLWRSAIDDSAEGATSQLALAVDKEVISGGRYLVSLDAAQSFEAGDIRMQSYFEIGTVVTTAFNDRDFDATFNAGAGPGITLDGDDSSQVQGLFGMGLNASLTKRLSAYVDYDYAFSDDEDHTVQLGLRVSF